MDTAKVAVTLDRITLARLDQLVKSKVFPSRSRAIQEALSDKLAQVDSGGLAIECAKLDSEDEKSLAEEDMSHSPQERWEVSPPSLIADDDDIDPDALQKAMAKLLNRTPEEIEATRTRLLAASRPPRPLPAGKTFVDVVCGQWPGDETDEEVFEALRELS